MLPFEQRPDQSQRERFFRWAGWIAIIAVVIVTVVQFQVSTAKKLRKRADYDRRVAIGEIPAAATPPRGHKGAIARWRRTFKAFWDGENIYRSVPDGCVLGGKATPPGVTRTTGHYLHPNMPFVVILMTPFAYMSPGAAVLVYNILKVGVLMASLLMAASIASHHDRKIPDWVLGLALLWGGLMLIGDIQHGNTNIFVLGGIVLHLWLYRKGLDAWAGAALAVAICLKMTPALFLLYWLYQRNWKLLAGAAVGGLVMTVGIPVAFMGWDRYAELKMMWFENLIFPGLVKGAWYPTHSNQSLSGIISRLFMDGANGDIFWDVDSDPHHLRGGSRNITILSMSPAAVRWMLRLGQAAVVGAIAWAVGWRKLKRTDGRRCLHYGLIVLGMMILNQRTWKHHAAVLLPAYLGVWYALFFANISSRVRRWSLALVLAAGPLVWLTRSDIFKLIAKICGAGKKTGELWGNIALAYGPTFLHFVLIFAAVVILASALRRSDSPYGVSK